MIIGTSREAIRMRNFAKKAGATDDTILLLGETGAGKDKLADEIHLYGREHKPFVPVDCGSMTESLSDNELFGHTRGAFTDAREIKTGLVQAAEHGTLFFNEIANMSLTLQAKFLRVLEKGSFHLIGGTHEVQVNTRFIIATNTDLEEAVREGKMRFDLFHRMNTITFTIAPLRERIEDIPLLAEHFLKQERTSKGFSTRAMATMMEYPWPGNVRELGKAVKRAVFHSSDEEEELGPENMGLLSSYLQTLTPIPATIFNVNDTRFPTFYEVERNYIKEVLTKAKGNKAQAAALASLDTKTMYNYIKRLNLHEFVEYLRKNKREEH